MCGIQSMLCAGSSLCYVRDLVCVMCWMLSCVMCGIESVLCAVFLRENEQFLRENEQLFVSKIIRVTIMGGMQHPLSKEHTYLIYNSEVGFLA